MVLFPWYICNTRTLPSSNCGLRIGTRGERWYVTWFPLWMDAGGAVQVSCADAAAPEQQQWVGGASEGQPGNGLDHASQHYKLFVGQVPMEVRFHCTTPP